MHAHLIDEAAVKAWMDAYGAAWIAGDADAAARLFAADASYQEHRFRPMLRGADAIGDYWRAGAVERRDVDFDHTVVAMRGYTVCVHWHASFTSVSAGTPTELDALSRIAFSVDRGSDGLLVAYAWDEWIDQREAEMTEAASQRPLPAL